MSWQRDLKKVVKGKVIFNEPLSAHTTFKIGGKAQCWVEPRDLEDLRNILALARKMHQDILVIGKGSNLLVSDKGIKGLVISLSQPFFKRIEFVNEGMRVGAGLGLSSLVNIAQREGLSGCEFLAGIPGTVGGALLMNAGVRADCIGISRYLTISDLVEEVQVMKYDGRTLFLRKKDLRFSYRASNLASYIIVSTRLKLKLKDKDEIKKITEKFWQHKKLYQELTRPNAGCIFKNPEFNSRPKTDQPLLSAGQMIDLCGLKGLSRGDAMISRLHANFILNNGHARAREVLALMKIMQDKVRQRFNFTLAPEIKVVGQ